MHRLCATTVISNVLVSYEGDSLTIGILTGVREWEDGSTHSPTL